MRVCPHPRSAFPRWWLGWGAAGKLPSKAVTISLLGKPARHRFRGRSRGAQPGIAREAV
jgi:hypothetical protein